MEKRSERFFVTFVSRPVPFTYIPPTGNERGRKPIAMYVIAGNSRRCLESCVSMCRASEVASFWASSMAEDARQVKKELDSEIHLVSHRRQWMERGQKKSANTGT